MTFQAEAYVPDACPCPDSPATATVSVDTCTIRMTPRHGNGLREVRVRYALYSAAGVVRPSAAIRFRLPAPMGDRGEPR